MYSNIIKFYGHNFRISKDHYRNMYVGTFIDSSELPKVYGDSYNEVINQAELLLEDLKNELC